MNLINYPARLIFLFFYLILRIGWTTFVSFFAAIWNVDIAKEQWKDTWIRVRYMTKTTLGVKVTLEDWSYVNKTPQ